VDGGVYRNAAAPIYSNAVFEQARLIGRWDQVAAFAVGPENGCAPGGAEFALKGGVMQVSYRLCLSGREVAGSGPISATGPGRFGIGGRDGLGQDWWVLWVDEGYRTMAIGNPSGTFGFILNRGKSLPADRLTAAGEVFDFNGYDTEKLSGFGVRR
jgi:apolipoprotein D and lipocalin family protein